MNKPITIKELKKFCEQEITKGRGDYAIMISNDDEGNGYHYLWFAFTTLDELMDDSYFDYYDTIDELDEQVAPKDKTIILG